MVQAAGGLLAECVLQSLAGATLPAAAAAPEGLLYAAPGTESHADPDSGACPDRRRNGLPGSQGGRPLDPIQPPGATLDPPAGQLQWAARTLRLLEGLCSCNTLPSLQLCLELTCSRPNSSEGSNAGGTTAAAQALAAVGGALEAALEAAALRPSEPSLQPSPELLRVVAQSGVQLAALAVWHRNATFQAVLVKELRTLVERLAPGHTKPAYGGLQSERLKSRVRELETQKMPSDSQLTPATAHIAAAAAGVLNCVLAVDVLDDSLAGSAASKLAEVLALLTAAPPSLHGAALHCCREASATLAAAAARSRIVRQRLAGADGRSWAVTAEALQMWLLGDGEQDRRRAPTQLQKQASEQLAWVSRLIPTAAAPSSGSSSAIATGTEQHRPPAAAASSEAVAAAARKAAEAAAAALLAEVALASYFPLPAMLAFQCKDSIRRRPSRGCTCTATSHLLDGPSSQHVHLAVQTPYEFSYGA